MHCISLLSIALLKLLTFLWTIALQLQLISRLRVEKAIGS